MDEEAVGRGRAALTDPDPDIRVGMAFVMGQLGAKLGGPLLPELLALVKDPEASVRGAAAIPLRAFVTDDALEAKVPRSVAAAAQGSRCPGPLGCARYPPRTRPRKGCGTRGRDRRAAQRRGSVRPLRRRTRARRGGRRSKAAPARHHPLFQRRPRRAPYAAAEAVCRSARSRRRNSRACSIRSTSIPTCCR